MKIYLAIPYSYNPEQSFKIANRVTARLMNEGHVVFSPITQGHTIAQYLPYAIKKDSDWWMKQDLPHLEWADELHVISIGKDGCNLIANSEGCQHELNHANKLGKKIKIIQYM